MRLKIQPWDPATMLKPHRKVLYIGRSGAGKSVAMRAVLRHVNVDLAVAFCPTDETRAELAKLIPPSCIHNALDLEVVERALQLQKELAHKQRSLLLLADDCAFSKGEWRTNTMRSVFMNARHHRTGLHFSMQYLMDLLPSLRSNVDYVICCAENIHSNKKKLWQAFFGIFKTYAEFDSVFTACTRDYSCIVLDQTQPSASVLNSIYYFRADLKAEAAPFRLCKPVFWKLHTRPPPKEEGIVADVPRRIMLDALS